MFRNNFNHRLARFAPLAGKNMLAGDVLVSVVDGALHVAGDAEANQIALTASQEAHAYEITGLEGTNLHLVDPVTNLPGPAVSSLTVTGVHGRVNIDLADGDDEVALFDAQFRGKVKIETGDGDDTVRVGAQAAAGTELADLLPDDVSVAIKGALHIDTGAGDDQIEVADAAVYGHLKVRAGDDSDIVSLGAAATTGVETLLADDLPDPVLTVYGAVNADLGEGDDQFSLVQVRARGSVYVDSALGDDDVDIRLSHLSHLAVDSGDGDDGVEVVDSVFAALSVKLGDGDDLFATAGLRAKLAYVSGGEGEDTLDELVESHIAHRIVRSIEVPPIDELPIFGRFCGLPLFGGGRLLGRFLR